MHRYYYISPKFYLVAVCQVLFSSTIFNAVAHPGFDSNHKNTFESFTEKKENVTLTLEDIFPDYIVTNEFCDDDSCKQLYEEAKYPYQQITEVFPEVSKRLWTPDVSTSIFSITDRAREEVLPSNSEVEENTVGFRMHTQTTSNINPIEVNRRVPVDSSPDVKRINRCTEIRQTILPITGNSDGKKYYITNIKTYSQTITVVKCYRAGTSCGNKSTDPENIAFRCKQEYEDAELSTFPVGENITLESHRRIPFKVPKGCSCSMTWLQ